MLLSKGFFFHLCRPRYTAGLFKPPSSRLAYSTRTDSASNTAVNHAQFLADAGSSAKWKASHSGASNKADADDFKVLEEGRGKLSPTASHLFKLILPLGILRIDQEKRTISKEPVKHAPPPTVILLHPSQPLSHASRLILASLAPATPTISFRSGPPDSAARQFQWSDSTDVGDFIRDAARSAQFSICISFDANKATHSDARAPEATLEVVVPTVADRTRFLRRRLAAAEAQLAEMEELKRACDREAHRGARRMASAGFGLLAMYWAAVARLTFWDYGWDIMEPITYLSGLTTVMGGYLWFLYQGREVSYTSVLNHSVSARREALYKSRGLDIERWADLRVEARALRKEIKGIEEDYEPVSGDEKEKQEDDGDEEETRREREEREAEREEEQESKKADRDSEGADGKGKDKI